MRHYKFISNFRERFFGSRQVKRPCRFAGVAIPCMLLHEFLSPHLTKASRFSTTRNTFISIHHQFRLSLSFPIQPVSVYECTSTIQNVSRNDLSILPDQTLPNPYPRPALLPSLCPPPLKNAQQPASLHSHLQIHQSQY